MPATSLHDDRVEHAAELERAAFNAAFYELGLHLYWDKSTYQATLATNSSEHDRVRGYLEREQPHLLRAYDADFLTDAVIRAKQRCQQSLTASAASAFPEVNWTEKQWEEAGF
jgi:hypothetical protein